MSVLGTFIIAAIVGSSSSSVTVQACGDATDGTNTAHFRNSSEGCISLSGLNPASLSFSKDVEAAVKTALQASPYNLTFGTGDVVRLLPAND
jgi:hypothetical protein